MNTGQKKFIGRKLYLKWDKNMYIAIEKIPDGGKKIVELDLLGDQGLELCNVFEDENGNKIEESLGVPAKNMSGFAIDTFFTESSFWKTPGELQEESNQNA